MRTYDTVYAFIAFGKSYRSITNMGKLRETQGNSGKLRETQGKDMFDFPHGYTGMHPAGSENNLRDETEKTRNILTA